MRRLAYELENRRPYQDHRTLQTVRLRCDNMGAVAVAKNGGRVATVLKHIDTRTKWVCARIKDKDFSIDHVPTGVNIADILTKPLPTPRFVELVELMGMQSVGGTPSEVRGDVNTCN